MNGDVNGNRKLFWKEVSNKKGGELQHNKGWKWEVGTEGEDEVRKIWKEYFEEWRLPGLLYADH